MADDFRILRDYSFQYLDAIVRLFQTHGYFTITLGTSDGHVWTTLFQMISEFVASAEKPFTGGAKRLAPQGTRHFHIGTGLQLVLNHFFVW